MRTYNAIEMKGRLYDFSLETISTEKGEALSGDVKLEVDEKGTVVTVRYFAYPTFNSGKPNRTYGILDEMMAGNYKTVTTNGDEASWLSLTGSIDVSYFIGRNATSDDDLARAQKLRGSFINPNKDKAYLNRWKLDMIVTYIKEVEADAEKDLPRYVRVEGYLIDDYNKRLMEVHMQARSEGAMNYILGLPASEEMPHYVSVWGQQVRIARLVVRENAFGEPDVNTSESTQWVITGMSPEAYDWNDEKNMTADDWAALQKGLAEHKKAQREKANTSADTGNLAF